MAVSYPFIIKIRKKPAWKKARESRYLFKLDSKMLANYPALLKSGSNLY
jgi:hypothetical protein